MKTTKLSELRHIVPASQPAWVRLIEACTWKELDGTETKEWQDIVLPVLAYAALPRGLGAYLVTVDSDGPCWFMRQTSSSDDRFVLVEFSYLQEPKRGVPPKGISPDFKYDAQDLSEYWDLVEWITD